MLGRKYFALQSTDKDNDYNFGKGVVSYISQREDCGEMFEATC